MKTEVNTRHDEVLKAIQDVKKDLGSFAGRLDQAEDRISTAEDTITTLESRLNKTQQMVSTLTSKCESLESQSRRNNMIVVGLPEKDTDGKDVEMFLERWIPRMIGDEEALPPGSVERGHRLGKPRGAAATTPRPLILKFLNFRDKTRVMKKARAKGKLMHGDHHIMFFNDFPQSVLERRKQYDATKAALRRQGIEDFGIIHPSRFRVNHGGRRHIFETPAEVDTFLSGIGGVDVHPRRPEDQHGQEEEGGNE